MGDETGGMMDNWIDVEDRLPEFNDECLFTEDVVAIIKHDRGDKCALRSPYRKKIVHMCRSHDKKNVMWIDSTDRPFVEGPWDQVILWQPLPDLPDLPPGLD